MSLNINKPVKSFVVSSLSKFNAAGDDDEAGDEAEEDEEDDDDDDDVEFNFLLAFKLTINCLKRFISV